MTATFGTTIATRIQLALQSPLQYRCEEITRIINELGTKELQNALPTLLADLFGVAGYSATPTSTTGSTGTGWGLRTIAHSNELTDYNVLYQFLRPQGPLFSLLYKLLPDCHLKYEFPLHWLPVRIQQMIVKGMVPPFYADKLQIDPQTRAPSALALNPFEFYIFHFAYHLVNPDLQRNQINAWLSPDSLYLYLAETYLTEFLPCDRSIVQPIVPYNFNVLQSYSASFSQYGIVQGSPALKSPSRATHSPHLLRHSVVQQSGTPGSLHTSPVVTALSTRTEIWRSETVAQVFVDFWLSHGESETYVGSGSPHRPYILDHIFPHHYFPLDQSAMHKLPLKYPIFAAFYLNKRIPFLDSLPGQHCPFPPKHELLPTGEHIRVVRSLIKYLHCFSSSVLKDHSAMDELRRIVVPSSQQKIYGFLRRTIHHWPLDSSFRFILETWLSYIQPWRYTDYQQTLNHNINRAPNWNADMDSETRTERVANQERRGVDRQWIAFLAENLLSYTVIFQEMLPRFARLDLSTPKNAHMLYRLSKVFSQPNLALLLREIESCLDDSLGLVSPHKRSMTSEFSTSEADQKFNHAAHQATKWSAIVRQQIQDLEAPGFHYKAMFGAETRVQMINLLQIVQHAQAAAAATQQALERDAAIQSRSKSFFSTLFDVLLLKDSTSGDEYSPEERMRVSAYLLNAQLQFSEIFRIQANDVHVSDASTSNLQSISGLDLDVTDSFSSARADRSFTSRGPTSQLITTPLAEKALRSTPQMWRQHSLNIHYDGDPDLLPIQSDENGFLVRLFYQAASRLNEMYSADMSRLFNRRDVLGRVARQVLLPPITVWRYDKSSPGNFSPRVRTVLPPRLSLRPFARHRNLAVFVGIYLVASLCGAPPLFVLTTVILVWVFLVIMKAVLEPWSHHPTQEPLINQSISNDSFS